MTRQRNNPIQQRRNTSARPYSNESAHRQPTRPQSVQPTSPQPNLYSMTSEAAASRSQKRNTTSPIRLVAFIVTLVVLLAVAGFAATTCSASSLVSARTPYTSPYNWDNLHWDNNRAVYMQNGEVLSKTGVDVSDHQGYIDWQQVAADGIDFAMIRIGNRGYTEGGLFMDEYFPYNIENAQAAGLDVGVYFFSQATTADEAREEAQFVLQLLEGYNLQMPVVFDHETLPDASARGNSVTGDKLVACMNAFCETIEASGYEAMVYGNRSDLARISEIDGSAEAAQQFSALINARSVWFAEYDTIEPTGPLDFIMWQYTNAGTVAGIDTSVDLNILLPRQ